MKLTPQQLLAVQAPGNILVVAGAGAGKTRTLVERCLRLLLGSDPSVDISRLLIVTFTEAAAAEIRERIRRELDQAASLNPHDTRVQQQIAGLDTAHISTLHSFCLSLLREHFYDLDLDPAVTVLPAEQAGMLFLTTFDQLLDEHFHGRHPFSAELQEVLRTHLQGWDKRLLALTRRIHHFTQTRPNPERWFQAQLQHLASPGPDQWRAWYAQAMRDWRAEWHPYLASLPPENENARRCAALLEAARFSSEPAFLQTLLALGNSWPHRRKKKDSAAFGSFFAEVDFLESLSAPAALDHDWNWSRGPLTVLLRFAQQFAQRFADAKRERGVVDFHDLEQFTLRLLWDPATVRPTPIAETWRERLDAVFVDEYQDINAAQDLIISALGRDGLPGNRFVVGDIKQSIYRFRQADPTIFQRYLNLDHGWTPAILSDNFRSHEGILQFINPLFTWLLQGTIGNVVYDTDAELRFGSAETRPEMALAPGASYPVELNLLIAENSTHAPADDEEGEPELENAEKEARLVAWRLRALRESGHVIYHQKEKRSRPVDWKDMVVLLRAAAGKLEVYAKAFEAMGVPLQTKRDGFFTTHEVLDLLNLLTILDNPLQDIPLVGVLRSPLVGMTANELALVRSHARRGPFWIALSRFLEIKKDSPARQKIEHFLHLFHRWRNPSSSASLAQRIEVILSDTGYADWLLTQPRGRQRHANLQQFLRVARQFDEARGESLYLFLRHIQDLQEATGDIEPAPSSDENAVRLMTIHQSKGLEFPVVAVADLGKRFNTSDRAESILLHEEYGICSVVQPPGNPRAYTSLPLWLASRQERIETIAEELRVFYVALTRAENLLLLFGSSSENQVHKGWAAAAAARPFPQQLLKLNSPLDWLGAYATWQWPGCFAENQRPSIPFVLNRHDAVPCTPPPASPPGKNWTEEQLESLRTRISFAYPHTAALLQSGKATVSALRRQATEQDEETAVLPARFSTFNNSEQARQRGLAIHTFLQHHEPSGRLDADGLRSQAAALHARNLLTAGQLDLIDFDAIAAFWKSETGLAVRDRVLDLHRELPFTVKLARADFASLKLDLAAELPDDEFLLVQGIADFVLLGPKDILLLDFKTDNITSEELEARAAIYRPQLALYSLALDRIYRRPVKQAGLHFLALRETVWL